jgi:diacylglycerol kinase family enzyme
MADPIAVIWNATAGASHRPGLDRLIADRLREQGLAAQILPASNGREIRRLARQARQEGCRMLVAAGGDGTVSSVASFVAGTELTLGVLPTGTLNHFARDLGIPLALNDAIRTLKTGQPLLVDVAEVNGRIFVNNSNLGLYPRLVAQRQARQRSGWSKWTAFFWALLATVRRFPFLYVRLQAGGRTFARKTPFVFVGNNLYVLEGLRIGSRPSLTRGELCLCVAHRVGRWGMARLALQALFGRLRKDRDFDLMCAQEILVDTRRKRLRVSLDGEVLRMRPPLRYCTRPAALRVMVPAVGD